MTPLYRFGNRVFLRLEAGVIFSSLVLFALPLTSCTIFATRPVQEMSDTAAAIKAAHEVQADTQAPELYRQANEWMIRAKNEYRLKNFALARDYSAKARRFAEQAEFESLKLGAARSDVSGFNENPAPPANRQPKKFTLSRKMHPCGSSGSSKFAAAKLTGPKKMLLVIFIGCDNDPCSSASSSEPEIVTLSYLTGSPDINLEMISSDATTS